MPSGSVTFVARPTCSAGLAGVTVTPGNAARLSLTVPWMVPNDEVCAAPAPDS